MIIIVVVQDDRVMITTPPTKNLPIPVLPSRHAPSYHGADVLPTDVAGTEGGGFIQQNRSSSSAAATAGLRQSSCLCLLLPANVNVNVNVSSRAPAAGRLAVASGRRERPTRTTIDGRTQDSAAAMWILLGTGRSSCGMMSEIRSNCQLPDAAPNAWQSQDATKPTAFAVLVIKSRRHRPFQQRRGECGRMRSGPLLLPERQSAEGSAYSPGSVSSAASTAAPGAVRTYERERERRRSQGAFGSGAGSASGSLLHRETMDDDDDEAAVRLAH
jgi:hypothetical protein